MLDHLSSILRNSEHLNIEDNKSFNCKHIVDSSTGEIVSTIGKYHNFNVRHNPKELRIRGSLHMFYNSLNGNGIINSNDFTYIQILEAILLLCNAIGCEPKDLPLSSLEFGVNVLLPEDAAEFLSRIITCLSGKLTKHQIVPFTLLRYDTNDYAIKIYDKGKQSGLRINLIRIELKIKNARALRKNEIFTMSDLMIKKTYKVLSRLLLDNIDNLIMVDQLAPLKEFNARELDLWNRAIDPDHWQTLKGSKRGKKGRLMDAYDELTEKFNLYQSHDNLRDLYWSKYYQLYNC